MHNDSTYHVKFKKRLWLIDTGRTLSRTDGLNQNEGSSFSKLLTICQHRFGPGWIKRDGDSLTWKLNPKADDGAKAKRRAQRKKPPT
jgi:hypothetical protein